MNEPFNEAGIRADFREYLVGHLPWEEIENMRSSGTYRVTVDVGHLADSVAAALQNNAARFVPILEDELDKYAATLTREHISDAPDKELAAMTLHAQGFPGFQNLLQQNDELTRRWRLAFSGAFTAQLVCAPFERPLSRHSLLRSSIRDR